MKKFGFILVLVTAVTIAFGQKNVRQSASNYLKDGKLDKALEAINACVLDPSTAQDAKAWFIRGNVYLAIANSTNEIYAKLDPDALSKALESYKKELEFDPKKEYYDEISLKIDKTHKDFYAAGVAKYDIKDFKEAMVNFGRCADVLDAIKIIDTTSLQYAAMCAGLAGEKEAAKGFYLRLIKGNFKSPSVFSSLSDLYLKDKDSANAFKYIRIGLKEYPNDMSLFTSEINIYLNYNIVDKAMNNLIIAMNKDTTNYSIPFALGTLYDNITNDTSKSAPVRDDAYKKAEIAYERALKLNPGYLDAIFNLGALNLNKSIDILLKANNLPPEATEDYTRLKKVAEGYLAKAEKQ